jgi:hypothetical protein
MEKIMSAADNNPSNKNFLSPLNFTFQIKKAPHVNFFIQKVNLPAISLRSVETSNPFIKIPYAGDHLDFGELKISFKVDEDFQNYLEIHNWLRALGKPEDFAQYKAISDIPSYTGDGIVSDISIIVLSSAKVANYDISYVDAFPVSLSDINFSTTDNDVNYIEASASFKYTYYNITKI